MLGALAQRHPAVVDDRDVFPVDEEHAAVQPALRASDDGSDATLGEDHDLRV